MYLKDKNQVLVQFLSNATMPKAKLLVNPKKNYNLCLVIEQILSLRNLNYIGPCSFAQLVVTWSLTGSKTVHSLQGITSSSGSITTLQNFLKCSSNETKNTCFPNECDIFAGNTQRKGKTTRITENGTTPLGIVMNVVFIESNFKTDIMKNPELSQ